jgi:hypothetical protein
MVGKPIWKIQQQVTIIIAGKDILANDGDDSRAFDLVQLKN